VSWKGSSRITSFIGNKTLTAMTVTSWTDLNALEQALDMFLEKASPKKNSCYPDARRLLAEVRKELIKATDNL